MLGLIEKYTVFVLSAGAVLLFLAYCLDEARKV